MTEIPSYIVPCISAYEAQIFSKFVSCTTNLAWDFSHPGRGDPFSINYQSLDPPRRTADLRCLQARVYLVVPLSLVIIYPQVQYYPPIT